MDLKIVEKVKRLLQPGEGLAQRTVRSGFWVAALRVTDRAFKLVRTIILARLLAPNDFGLMGIALLMMAVLETFSQTGFEQALIQKKQNIEGYLDSAWTVLVLRGSLLFVVLWLISPYAAIFFNVPQAKLVMQVIGISLLLRAFSNVAVIYFQKELEFNKQFILEVSGTLADFIVAVSAALILRSVWALVFGLLAGNAARLVVSYLIHPYRPTFTSDLGKAKELFVFGKWLFGASILLFLIKQGDDAFVGKLLGATMLGFYQMAYRISNIPTTEITHVISQVTFPAYSKLRDNIPKLREAYLKVLQVTAFLSFPIAGLIFVLAPDFTKIFLGEKWMPIVPAMQIFCVLGINRSIAAASGPIFLATGRPDIEAKLPAAQLLLLAILIYPLTAKWGIAGTAASVVIVSCIFFFIILSIVSKLIKMEKLDVINLMKIISFPLLPIILLIFTKIFILDPFVINDILNFSTSVITGIFLYLMGIYTIDKYSDYNALKNIVIIFRNLKR